MKQELYLTWFLVPLLFSLVLAETLLLVGGGVTDQSNIRLESVVAHPLP